MTGRHVADKLTKSPGIVTAIGPVPARELAPLPGLPALAGPARPHPARPYVPLAAPVMAPGWSDMLAAGDFFAAYDVHFAPMIRSLVWAYYKDAESR